MRKEEKKSIMLHEIVDRYKAQGVKHMETMLDLSRQGFVPEDIAGFGELNPTHVIDYARVGVKTIEEMQEFKKINIHAETLRDYYECGFTSIEDIKTITEKGLDKDGFAISVYSNHCGFAGDLDAIIELSEGGVEWGYAWDLAKHGLEGDKKAMLDVASKVSRIYFSNLVKLIANKLSGNIPYDEQFGDIRYSKQAEELADKINPHHIAILADSRFGKEYLEVDRALGERVASFDDDPELVNQYIEQSKEDHAKMSHRPSTHQLYCQITDKRQEKLFEAYQFLVENGEEKFKEKYNEVPVCKIELEREVQ